MEAALVIIALLFVAFMALGVFVTVKVVGAAKRGVDRTITQARRTVEDTTLRAKSIGQVGVAAELAQLRLRLRTSMRATQDALETGVREDASLAESVELFRRLSAHGRELDDELRQLERDPDRVRIGERLVELRERTERITGSADSLRWAARDRARKFAEDDLSSLSTQIDVESGALRHWADPEPEPRPEARPESRSEPRAKHGEGARPEHGEGSRSGSGQRPALDPSDAPWGSTYPWQKPSRQRQPRQQPRPEATN
ncbi:hypothetical protein [Streptomyces paludis]|uniref:hypothetical protein n=1 Tax=Streptomyces paludis TaxID=2282738 RepID=UPI001E2A913B|nr:hypothetical protein [Streptomyces paludis]